MIFDISGYFVLMFLLPAGSSQSEPVDWLGFSRLGSPDSAPRDVTAGKDAAAAAAEKPSTTASAGKDVGRQTESSDGSSAVLARRTPALGRVPKTDKDDALRGSLRDDKAENSSLDWLEMAADRSAEKKPMSGRKSLDSTQDDDWLGTMTRSAAEKTESASDYLGLGSEIALTEKPSRSYCVLL